MFDSSCLNKFVKNANIFDKNNKTFPLKNISYKLFRTFYFKEAT